MAVLGIDTSNYRTSLCIINEQFQVIEELNPLLPVDEGELGLQQSKAVFEHLKQWSGLLSQLSGSQPLQAVGVSVRPRPIEGSYMPVFKVGEVLAETLAHFLSIPLIKTSHQEGHIAAGEYSIAQPPTDDSFLAVHLSGGTSEILHCTRKQLGYEISRLGGTLDLHAGQFVDRVGVELKLPFPAGPHLEQLATEWENNHQGEECPIIPSFTDGASFSFSGQTTAAKRLIEQGKASPGQIARAVEKTIAKTLEKALVHAMGDTGLKQILLVGGVASNTFITQALMKRLEHPSKQGKLFVAKPSYATDNAFGVACLALQQYLHTSHITKS